MRGRGRARIARDKSRARDKRRARNSKSLGPSSVQNSAGKSPRTNLLLCCFIYLKVNFSSGVYVLKKNVY